MASNYPHQQAVPLPGSGMSATNRLSFEEFWKLQEAAQDTAIYELDEGELLLMNSRNERPPSLSGTINFAGRRMPLLRRS